MMRKLITYLTLIVLGSIFLKPMIPIGDYCNGLLNILNFFFVGGLLVLIVLILTIINIIGMKKNKIRFDFIPLSIVFFLGITCFLISGQEERKFWTKTTFSGLIEFESTRKRASLKLFKNETFAITLHNTDFSCTYQGNYEMTNGKLNLMRADLPELTEEIFTTEYVLNVNDQTLNPTDKNFKMLKIIK